MIELRGMGCCGLREITGLSLMRDRSVTTLKTDPKLAMSNVVATMLAPYPQERRIAKTISEMNWIDAVFTQANTTFPYGEDFRNYILDHRLGSVISNDFKRNPNSSNQIRTYVWTMDRSNLAKWALKEGVVAC